MWAVFILQSLVITQGSHISENKEYSYSGVGTGGGGIFPYAQLNAARGDPPPPVFARAR